MDPDPAQADPLLSRQGELRRFARRLASDPHLAEDLIQETYLVALDPHRPTVAALLPWMKGVLRRLLRNELRRSARRRSRETCAARLREPFDDAGAREERRARVLARLQGLAEPYRSTLLERYVEGLTPAEIASRRNLPIRTVHTRTARGLALLRKELFRDDDDRLAGWACALARQVRNPALAWPGLAAGLAGFLLLVASRAEAPALASARETAGVPWSPTSSEYELLIFDASGAGPSMPCPPATESVALTSRSEPIEAPAPGAHLAQPPSGT